MIQRVRSRRAIAGEEGPDAFARMRARDTSTHSAAPVCTAAGLAVFSVLEREGLREHAAAVGLNQ